MDNNSDRSNVSDFVEQLEAILEKIPEMDDDSAESLDRQVRRAISQLTAGLSPIELAGAYTDWLCHLAVSPGRREKLRHSLVSRVMALSSLATAQLAMKDEPLDIDLSDNAFRSEAWQKPPFNLMAKAYTEAKSWLQEASADVTGTENNRSELVEFINQQLMEMLSPANFPITNPEVIATTREEKGNNLLRGLSFLCQDLENKSEEEIKAASEFKVGVNLGLTPGKVVFQNELIELIQYAPTTEKVSHEPILFVPAWIMKYYILDLTPDKSMIKYMVDQGKTVFTISWKNPTKEDREVSMDDYLNKGFRAAVDAVQAIVPNTKINAVGYCIGGTLLSIGAAVLAREDNDILNSITLFAAQVDFSEAGEIKRLLSTSQLAFLDSHMWTEGYLSPQTMSASFKALRPREQIWDAYINRYYLGREEPSSALMAWNADGTRMPFKMHSRYLKELYMENRLAECKFLVGDKPVSLLDIRAPMFVVGTTTDHIAPWKSVYKIMRHTTTEITFLLTNGGHNAGIISGPVHPRRKHQIATRKVGDKYTDPDTWASTQPVNPGSWWPVWAEWINEHSQGSVKPPSMGASRKGYKPLRDAPGEYVFG